MSQCRHTSTDFIDLRAYIVPNALCAVTDDFNEFHGQKIFHFWWETFISIWGHFDFILHNCICNGALALVYLLGCIHSMISIKYRLNRLSITNWGNKRLACNSAFRLVTSEREWELWAKFFHTYTSSMHMKLFVNFMDIFESRRSNISSTIFVFGVWWRVTQVVFR